MNKDVYKKVVESLKLANRAELTSIDPNLANAIDKCYVDPVGDSIVLDQVLNRIPCYLIGRKGTGKSTIFQKAQIEVGKKEDSLGAYIDVNSIYENVSKTYSLEDEFYLKELGAESVRMLSRYFILKKTIEKIYQEILKSVSDKSEKQKSLLSFFSSKKKDRLSDIEAGVKALLDSLAEDKYHDLSLLKTLKVDTASFANKDQSEKNEIAANADLVKLGASAKTSESVKQSNGISSGESFSQIVARYISIQDKFSELKKIFEKNGFNRIYLFIDDYSELDEDVQETILKAIIEPLYFYSEEFININVAGYPKRINFGKIKTDKVEIIHLDFQDLYTYYKKDINKREPFAKDKIKELIEKRFSFYSQGQLAITHYLDPKFSYDDLIDLIFDITLGNPRYIGWLLDYTGRQTVLGGDLITEASVKSASQHYYEAKIESKIDQVGQALLPFDEIVDFASHIDLLKKLLDEARKSKNRIVEYEKYTNLKNAQVSYFYTDLITSKFLSLLELNFFIHRIRFARDKKSNDVQIFCLNHGLCQKHKINFGRPVGTEYRDYLIEVPFSRSSTITDHFSKIREIKCKVCGCVYSEDKLPALEMFNFRCSNSGCNSAEGSVAISYKTPLADKIKDYFPEELKQDIYSIELLYTIKANNEEVYASQIAQALDKHHISVGQKASQLKEKGYLDRESKNTSDAGKRVFYTLRKQAEDIFFNAKKKLSDLILTDDLD